MKRSVNNNFLSHLVDLEAEGDMRRGVGDRTCIFDAKLQPL